MNIDKLKSELTISALNCFTHVSARSKNDYDLDIIRTIQQASNIVIQSNSSDSPIGLLQFFNHILDLTSNTRGDFSFEPMQMSNLKMMPHRPSLNEAQVIIKSGLRFHRVDNVIKMMFNLWKAQLFYDANKRSAYFFTNYYLIHYFHIVLILNPHSLQKWSGLIKQYLEIGRCHQLIKNVRQDCIID